MARQPFLPKYAGAPWRLGIDAAKARPAMLALIGEYVVIWPYVEHQIALVLGHLLGSNTAASLAVFTSLKSTRVQQDAVSAAAKAVLDDQGVELVEAALIAIATAEKTRNAIVHGNWGESKRIPNGLIWIDPKEHAPKNTVIIQRPGIEDTYAELAKRFYVYTEDDLRAAIKEATVALKIGGTLLMYLREGTPQSRALRYETLCSLPPLRAALDHLRKRKSRREAQN